VEESELHDVAAAEERFQALSAMLGSTVGMVHGRMKPAERAAVMGL
jgi:ATP-dependent DNA helicase RecG